MSDLDEPPAKVLKIDNIDGVTHVTELNDFPVPFDGVPEEEILGEQSGIIEGGADNEPGQEEWLSEGILTDDDYNPASQETGNDRADSQLDSSQDEGQLDTTVDSDTLAEMHKMVHNDGNLAGDDANLTGDDANLTGDDANLTRDGANLSGDGANLTGDDANFTGDDANSTGNEEHLDKSANLSGNDLSLTESDANLVQNDADISNGALLNSSLEENETNGQMPDTAEQSEMQIDENLSIENGAQVNNEVNMSMSDENLTDTVEQLMSKMDSNAIESQTYTQEFVKLEPSISSGFSDIVIQRVVTLNKNPNVSLSMNEIEAKTVELNIEETMKNLDGEADIKSDDFDSLLKKNTDTTSGLKSKIEKREEEDDGNDTDDLLRMLGEEDNKIKKKLTKTVKDIRAAAGRHADSSDDEDYVYKGKGIQSLKAAQEALAKKKTALKAEPEDMDDDDNLISSEAKTVQNIFGVKSGTSILRQTHLTPANVLKVVEKPRNEKAKQYQNKRMSQSLLKPSTPTLLPKQLTAAKSVPVPNNTQAKTSNINTSTPLKPSTLKTVQKKTSNSHETTILKSEPNRTTNDAKMKQECKLKYEPKIKTEAGMIKIEPKMKVEPSEIIDEAEFLDDEEFELDEDEFAESDNDISYRKQRIMKPEVMDEEVPSDEESDSENGSLYDEMPTSESDDMEDWFQLDIRSEKAADYLPLLGPKAKELLQEEKRRVAARLSSLRQQHTALSTSGKQQAALLRRATASLAEIDDMLRAA